MNSAAVAENGAPDAVIRAIGLSKTFDDGRLRLEVLRGICRSPAARRWR
jgi:hypothetical protein